MRAKGFSARRSGTGSGRSLRRALRTSQARGRSREAIARDGRGGSGSVRAVVAGWLHVWGSSHAADARRHDLGARWRGEQPGWDLMPREVHGDFPVGHPRASHREGEGGGSVSALGRLVRRCGRLHSAGVGSLGRCRGGVLGGRASGAASRRRSPSPSPAPTPSQHQQVRSSSHPAAGSREHRDLACRAACTPAPEWCADDRRYRIPKAAIRATARLSARVRSVACSPVFPATFTYRSPDGLRRLERKAGRGDRYASRGRHAQSGQCDAPVHDKHPVLDGDTRPGPPAAGVVSAGRRVLRQNSQMATVHVLASRLKQEHGERLRSRESRWPVRRPRAGVPTTDQSDRADADQARRLFRRKELTKDGVFAKAPGEVHLHLHWQLPRARPEPEHDRRRSAPRGHPCSPTRLGLMSARRTANHGRLSARPSPSSSSPLRKGS